MAKIKYKCSIVIISLVESRQDDEVLSKIANGIKIDLIFDNIFSTYLNFVDNFGREYND